MAIKNLKEMVNRAKEIGTKKIAVAVAEDEEVLAALKQASDEGLARGILTGDEKKNSRCSFRTLHFT